MSLSRVYCFYHSVIVTWVCHWNSLLQLLLCLLRTLVSGMNSWPVPVSVTTGRDGGPSGRTERSHGRRQPAAQSLGRTAAYRRQTRPHAATPASADQWWSVVVSSGQWWLAVVSGGQ